MRIAYHHHAARRASSGAGYFYSDTSRLLAAAGGRVRPQPHDLFQLLLDGDREQAAFVRSLDVDDVLVCNAGPYGHLFHALRERHGGRFRIVRDVRTSSWSGYLLQERLCGALARAGDRVLFPSEFCRRYFAHHVPGHTGRGSAAACYPLLAAFPEVARAPAAAGRLRLGYLGRVSVDKGFGTVLDHFARVWHDDHRATLDVAGAVEGSSPARQRARIAARLAELNVPADRVNYRGHLAYADIWPFLGGLDVLLFPAVSSVESLGRVLLEACHAGVRTVAAAYAAAPEILPAANLMEPVFRFDESLDLIQPFSFGSVAAEGVVQAVRGSVLDRGVLSDARFQAATYMAHVAGEDVPDRPAPLAEPVQRFVNALEIEPGAGVPSADEALRECGLLLSHFRQYFANGLVDRVAAFWGALQRPPAFPHERQLAWHRLAAPQQRLLTSHARAHCAAAAFRPVARLRRERWNHEVDSGALHLQAT